MSDREPLTPELKAVEAALASLVPTSVAPADRDRVMFAAGRAAGRPHRPWVWPAATSLVAAAALIVGRWSAPVVVGSPEPLIATQAAPVPAPSDATFTAVDLAAPTSYFLLRQHLDRLDVAVYVPGNVPPIAADHPSRQALLRELLN